MAAQPDDDRCPLPVSDGVRGCLTRYARVTAAHVRVCTAGNNRRVLYFSRLNWIQRVARIVPNLQPILPLLPPLFSFPTSVALPRVIILDIRGSRAKLPTYVARVCSGTRAQNRALAARRTRPFQLARLISRSSQPDDDE